MRCKYYNTYSVLCASCDYPNSIKCCVDKNEIENIEKKKENKSNE